MTSEMMDRIKRDFNREPDKDTLSFEAYVAGYMAGVKRFGQRPDYKEIRSKLGYSRIGLGNV
jgi:hypothetical protein